MLSYFQFFNPFVFRFVLIFITLFALYVVMMSMNISLLLSSLLCFHKVSFSNLYVPTHPNKIMLLKCKNHQLIETALTLLLHNHVPMCFWNDAIPVASYLINDVFFCSIESNSDVSIVFVCYVIFSSSYFWLSLFYS